MYVLAFLLNLRPTSMRVAAAERLGVLGRGRKSSVKALQQASRDPDREVAAAASQALAALQAP